MAREVPEVFYTNGALPLLGSAGGWGRERLGRRTGGRSAEVGQGICRSGAGDQDRICDEAGGYGGGGRAVSYGVCRAAYAGDSAWRNRRRAIRDSWVWDAIGGMPKIGRGARTLRLGCRCQPGRTEGKVRRMWAVVGGEWCVFSIQGEDDSGVLGGVGGGGGGGGHLLFFAGGCAGCRGRGRHKGAGTVRGEDGCVKDSRDVLSFRGGAAEIRSASIGLFSGRVGAEWWEAVTPIGSFG